MNRRHLLLTCFAAAGAAAPLLAGTQASASGKGNSGAGKDSYIAMNSATGVVPRRDGRRSTLTVEIGIDVPDRTLRERAVLSRPRLTAAYSEVVHRTSRALLPGRVPDIDALGTALQAATDRILGQQGAKVLLGSVIVL